MRAAANDFELLDKACVGELRGSVGDARPPFGDARPFVRRVLVLDALPPLGLARSRRLPREPGFVGGADSACVGDASVLEARFEVLALDVRFFFFWELLDDPFDVPGREAGETGDLGEDFVDFLPGDALVLGLPLDRDTGLFVGEDLDFFFGVLIGLAAFWLVFVSSLEGDGSIGAVDFASTLAVWSSTAAVTSSDVSLDASSFDAASGVSLLASLDIFSSGRDSSAFVSS